MAPPLVGQPACCCGSFLTTLVVRALYVPVLCFLILILILISSPQIYTLERFACSLFFFIFLIPNPQHLFRSVAAPQLLCSRRSTTGCVLRLEKTCCASNWTCALSKASDRDNALPRHNSGLKATSTTSEMEPSCSAEPTVTRQANLGLQRTKRKGSWTNLHLFGAAHRRLQQSRLSIGGAASPHSLGPCSISHRTAPRHRADRNGPPATFVLPFLLPFLHGYEH
jgi:hypothetical protein